MIAIIGGGPAGIALGMELDKRSLPYELFEAQQLASTWRSVPAGLRVLSPWWTNVLQFRHALAGNPFRKASADVYLAHLEEIASMLKGRVRTNCRVEALRSMESGLWTLHTTHGEVGPYSAVVMATGYFSTPRAADPSITSDGSLPVLHAAQIVDYGMLESLRDGDLPVVVVGRRVTAGQLLLELNERGIPAALSIRSPMEYRRSGIVGSIREMIYFFWEELQARLTPGLRRSSFPVMEGGRTAALVTSGVVPVFPMIQTVKGGAVLLEDGREIQVAALVLATGYRPGLDLLPVDLPKDAYGIPCSRGFQLSAMPGVYLLGFDNLYDHRSRYLRGIRLDAARLAERLMLSGVGVEKR